MEIIEVARSFSRKLDIGNYQNVDLFCSMKANLSEGDNPLKVSQELYEMCKSEVMRDAKAIKDKLKGVS